MAQPNSTARIHFGRRALLALGLVVSAVLAPSGCLWRPVPIPPPMAVTYASTICQPTDDCDGGVIFTIEGRGQPGALVNATNSSRTLADGNGYSASVMVRREFSVPDGGVPDGGVGAINVWRITLAPQRSRPGDPVTACHPGDLVVIRQLVPDGSGVWNESGSVSVIVPAP